MSIFPTKILLATDGSSEAELASRSAVNLSQKTASELHVIHALDIASIAVLYPEATDPEGVELPDPILEEDLERSAEQRGREVLDAEIQRVQSAGGTVAQAHLVVGEVAREIVHLAENLGVGLIVVGSRGRGGIRRALMGSISASVVRHAHCPVLVVRGESVIFPTKIVLATDGSKDANLASSTAADLSMSTGSQLHVVRVGHMPSVYYESPGAILLDPDLQSRMEKDAEEATKTRLGEQVQMIRETGSEVTEAHARIGRPDAEIVGLAGRLGAGLIVVGSRGLGPLRRALMGSVSDSVVGHAHCPVLVVRQEPAHESLVRPSTQRG